MVATLSISNLAKDSVVLNGEINSDGNGNIKECGFYWGITDKTEYKVKAGSAIDGKFSYTLKPLESETAYYYKAYAINEKGESVGEIITFKSLDKDAAEGVPFVSTVDATDITINSAILNGIITSPGNSEVIQRGFYFGTNPEPTIRYVVDDNSNNIFSYVKENLSEQTTYYYKAFAKNSAGYSYGDVKSFITKIKPKFVLIEYLGKATHVELYAKFETGDCLVVEAGFLIGYDYYNSNPTLNSNYNNNREIVKCEIKDNSISCKHTSYYYENGYNGFYCRPYFIIDGEAVFYGESKYVYPGSTYTYKY